MPKIKKIKRNESKSYQDPIGIISEEDKDLVGNKLPTNLQVLKCFMYIRQKNPELSSHSQALQVAEKVLIHSKKAGIEAISKKKMAEKIEVLLKKSQLLRKNYSKKKIDEYNDLKKTFVFWPRNILEEMRKRLLLPNLLKHEKEAILEDLKFLENMLTVRTMSYGTTDNKFFKIVDKRIKKNVRQRKEEQLTNANELSDVEMLSDESENNETISSNVTDVFKDQPEKRKHRRSKKRGTSIFIPHDILKNEALQSCAVRNKISPTALSSIIKTFVEACNGNSSEICLHHTQSQRLLK